MNQSIEPSIEAVMPELRRSGLLSSLCTITTPPGTFDAGGAPDPNAAYQDLAGHVNIPCMKAPIDASETKTLDEILSRNLSRMLLNDYYPEIIANYRAVVDGVDYDVLGVEHDSQHRMTRLTVSKVAI